MSAPTIERISGDTGDGYGERAAAIVRVLEAGTWLPSDLIAYTWWDSLAPGHKLDIIETDSIPPLALAVEQEQAGIDSADQLKDELATVTYEQLWLNLLQLRDVGEATITSSMYSSADFE